MPAYPYDQSLNEKEAWEGCPYCTAENKYLILHIKSFRIFQIKCLNCECLGPLGDNKQQALDRWNNRGHQGFIRNLFKKWWERDDE